MTDNNNQTQQREINARRITSEHNPMLGDRQPAWLHVCTVNEEYGKYAKLAWNVFDAQGAHIFGGNVVIKDEQYTNWDGNDLDYPYTVVCQERGFTLVQPNE